MTEQEYINATNMARVEEIVKLMEAVDLDDSNVPEAKFRVLRNKVRIIKTNMLKVFEARLEESE